MRYYGTKECVVCGGEYRAKATNQKYCGAKCKALQHPDRHTRYAYVILERDGYQCAYCGVVSFKDRKRMHLDHIVPRKLGGEDIASNLITACKYCNISKGKRKLDKEITSDLLKEVERRNKLSRLPGWTPISFQKIQA